MARPLTLRSQMELVQCDLDDGAGEVAVALRELEHVLRRLRRAYLHNARGFRRGEIVQAGIATATAPWDGVERRADWSPEKAAA